MNSQVSRIAKSAESLKQIEIDSVVHLQSKKAVNLSKFPELDRELYQWFQSVTNPTNRWKPLPISRSILQSKALKIAEQLGIKNFKASDGWFGKWRRRLGVGKSVRLHGEAGDVNLVAAENEMNDTRENLASYSNNNVFNMDETGLFYKCLPKKSYPCDGGDERQRCRGTKAMSAKDRLTLVLCVNATGMFINIFYLKIQWCLHIYNYLFRYCQS